MGEFEEKLNAILGNQDAMGQIMALAQSLGKPSQEESPTPSQPEEAPPPMEEGENPLGMLGSIDPKLIQMGMQLMQEYQGGDDRNAALLTALRPFLRPERHAKLDKAIQIAKLSRIIRVAFQTMGGESHHV